MELLALALKSIAIPVATWLIEMAIDLVIDEFA
jgi:hypothetical protein